jgi:hypothetical protein
MLAQFHEAEQVEKEKFLMQKKPSFAKGSQVVTKVCHKDVSSCSSSPHQDENVSLDGFKEHTYGIGYKLVTKMGYDGKGLGINGQGMTNPIQAEERPRYAGLKYGQEKMESALRQLK